MEKQDFEKLLLKASFSCMVCDGNIGKNELDLIRTLFQASSFNEIQNVDDVMNQFINEINQNGNEFLRLFLKELKQADLSIEEEISLIDFSLKTMYSDFDVKYNEIKFFKNIRSYLKISNEEILEAFPSNDIFLEKSFELIKEKLPTIEQFLENDIITDNYLKKLQDDYFTNTSLPQFETISTFNGALMDSMKKIN
jgi:uncharacterized tellurite resistance protein B-like protein